MNPSQSLARPLLASMFIAGGIDSIRNSEAKVKAAEAVVKPISQAFPIVPDDTETLVKLNGAVQVGAGVMLATGKTPPGCFSARRFDRPYHLCRAPFLGGNR